jgi:cellulose synthase/poly-beta-1,6-N-acetylglucosamine synthase-like glycosyltransferase
MTDRIASQCALPRVHLDLTPPDRQLAGALPPAFALRNDCLPWRLENGTLLVATARPEAFPSLGTRLAQLPGPTPPRMRAVVVSREECQRHAAALYRTALANRMLTRVPQRYSCRAWGLWNKRRMVTASALTALPILFLAYAPALMTSLLIYIALTSMAVACVLKTTAAFARLTEPARPIPPLDDADLPVISILVPLFREPQIAETLILRLLRLRYPRDRLEVLLVLEETDHVTRDALRDIALPNWMRIVTVPDGAPRTKPRAMNYALDFCRGTIVGIYDAEDDPDPDQLIQVAATFASAPDDVACLQGVLDYYNPNSTWIARCFTIEYNTWFRLILPGMARLGFALPLGGTTLFMRRDRLERLGAWDAHNVTEDADLGFRLARGGYRTMVIDSTTREEANNRPLPWIRQRSRWLKGYAATYLVHMRSPRRLLRDLGPWQFIGFQAHFVTALSQFTLAPLLWLFWLVTLGVDLPHTTLDDDPRVRTVALVFLGQEVLTMMLGAIATRRGGHKKLWAWVPLMHLYWPLGTIAMWKALYELILRPFYWDKTAHGHSLPKQNQPPDHSTAPTSPESSLSRVT